MAKPQSFFHQHCSSKWESRSPPSPPLEDGRFTKGKISSSPSLLKQNPHVDPSRKPWYTDLALASSLSCSTGTNDSLELLQVTRASSLLTPVDEFFSTSCAMSSLSSLPALPFTIYGCMTLNRSHLVSFPWFQPRTKCPWIAAASATMLFAGASCEMAARCPENLLFSQCRPFDNLQIWWGGEGEVGNFTQKYQNV